MLTVQPISVRQSNRGIVLIMALIVLVAMTLGAVALVRSVYTSNVIAGNLAFQQSATHSADAGVEAAIAWLESNTGQPAASGATVACISSLLACDQKSAGYLARRQDPGSQQSWRDFWQTTLSSNAKTLAKDSAGNTVYYIIQRLCTSQGSAQDTSNECLTSPRASAGTCAGGSSCDSQRDNLAGVGQVYYRITVKVVGPRNTESFTQTTVAL